MHEHQNKEQDPVIQDLENYYKQLDQVNGLEDMLCVYERIFSILNQALLETTNKNQSCQIITLNNDNTALIDETSQQVVLKDFKYQE